jgi:glycosyltransferase involved in cell wall biosynthesis
VHIAYVTTGYPWVSHTFIQNEVLGLRALGVEVDTFTIARSPRSECRTDADREAYRTTYALRPPKPGHYARAHLTGLLTRPARYLAAFKRALRMAGPSPRDLVRHVAYFVQGVVLWDRCQRGGVAHVHAHFANVSSDVAMVAAMLGGDGFTWSYTMHGPTEFYDLRHHRLAEKATDAAFVICISDFARSQLMGIVDPDEWTKLRVVHCGVDVARFAPAAATRLRGDGPVMVACVGRLVPEKGQSLLIEAVGAMRAAGVDVRLALVGDGPQRESLERHVDSSGLRDRVVFHGAVAHTEIERILHAADIFCLPSFAEGIPIVLMEAMAMELPVVACQVMGIPELIQDDVTGCLVRPGSRDALLDALSVLAADPDRRAALGRAARARVAAEFELGTNVAQLRDVYAEYLGRSG